MIRRYLLYGAFLAIASVALGRWRVLHPDDASRRELGLPRSSWSFGVHCRPQCSVLMCALQATVFCPNVAAVKKSYKWTELWAEQECGQGIETGSWGLGGFRLAISD